MKYFFPMITLLSFTTVYSKKDISKRLGEATSIVDHGNSEGVSTQYENVGDTFLDTDMIPNLEASTDVIKPPLVTKYCNQKGRCYLKRCEGDCGTDLHCDHGFKCFQRDGFTPVPGCSGKGVSGTDYCISEREIENKGWKPVVKLNLCEGDCDIDTDCVTGFKCFHRDYDERVPGCVGDTISAYDYCIQKRTIVDLGRNPKPPLRLCEGDCDYDSHCAGALRCFQRGYGEPVPGCIGFGVTDGDYCID